MNIAVIKHGSRQCANCGKAAKYAIGYNAGGSTYICKGCLRSLVVCVLNEIDISEEEGS